MIFQEMSKAERAKGGEKRRQGSRPIEDVLRLTEFWRLYDILRRVFTRDQPLPFYVPAIGKDIEIERCFLPKELRSQPAD